MALPIVLEAIERYDIPHRDEADPDPEPGADG